MTCAVLGSVIFAVTGGVFGSVFFALIGGVSGFVIFAVVGGVSGSVIFALIGSVFVVIMTFGGRFCLADFRGFREAAIDHAFGHDGNAAHDYQKK